MIAIIKSVGNNLASIQYALQRLQANAIITDDPQLIKAADHVIMPGVGHAASTMQRLHQAELVNVILQLTQPVLGICLGMQLLYQFTEEGNTHSLGIIPHQVSRLIQTEKSYVPHMGWNRLVFQKDSPLLHGIKQHDAVYFTHSYAAPVNQYTIATAHHGQEFSAMVYYRNFYGMQFHPERSGDVGTQLLQNFIHLR